MKNITSSPEDTGARSRHAIAYVADANFAPYACHSILSLAEPVRHGCDFFLFVDAREPVDLLPYITHLSQKVRHIEVIAKDMKAADDWKRSRFVSTASFGRLCLQHWIPRDYERVLYLDGDTLAGPIPVDMDADLGGHPLGAVEDYGLIASGKVAQLRQAAGLPPEGTYFNAGVLLIDWPKWLESGLGDRAFAVLASGEKLADADQAALNRVCDGDWKILPPDWNVHPEQFRNTSLMRSARILHFTGSKKPWQADRWKYDEKYSDHYLEQARCGPITTPVRQKTRLSSVLRRLRRLVPLWMDRRRRRYRSYMKRRPGSA